MREEIQFISNCSFSFLFFLVLDGVITQGIPLLFQVSPSLVMQIALNNTVPAPVSTHIASSRE